jgi:hypothetical protein
MDVVKGSALSNPYLTASPTEVKGSALSNPYLTASPTEVKGSALSNPYLTASPTASGIAGIAGIASKYERIILQNKCPREEEECSICLDSLYMKQIAYLPCKHSFHQKCIQYSFEKKLYSCPLCRYDLLTALKKTNFIFPVVYDPYTYTYTYPYPYTYDYTYIYDYIILADGLFDYTNDIDNNHNDFGIPPLIVSEEYNMQYWSNIMVNIMPAAIPAAIPLAVGAAIPLAVGVGAEVVAAVGGAVGAAIPLAVGLEVGLEVGLDGGVEPSTDDDDNITFHEFLIFYN